MQGYLMGSVDLAVVALYAFFLFFIGLVIWLRREDRREGYPLEEDLTGLIQTPGGPLNDPPLKIFHLAHGHGTVATPRRDREPITLPGTRRENFPGAPIIPASEGLPIGIGPGAFAARATYPDVDAFGRPRIVPASDAEEIDVARASRDPRGMTVYGADRRPVGPVTEIWVDRAEHILRYLQVETATGPVLAPMAMANVRSEGIVIDAINAAHFAAAPRPATPGQITRDEEERVVGYFGGGYLYANLDRQEPWL